jgi:hypothetical protein
MENRLKIYLSRYTIFNKFERVYWDTHPRVAKMKFKSKPRNFENNVNYGSFNATADAQQAGFYPQRISCTPKFINQIGTPTYRKGKIAVNVLCPSQTHSQVRTGALFKGRSELANLNLRTAAHFRWNVKWAAGASTTGRRSKRPCSVSNVGERVINQTSSCAYDATLPGN